MDTVGAGLVIEDDHASSAATSPHGRRYGSARL